MGDIHLDVFAEKTSDDSVIRHTGLLGFTVRYSNNHPAAVHGNVSPLDIQDATEGIQRIEETVRPDRIGKIMISQIFTEDVRKLFPGRQVRFQGRLESEFFRERKKPCPIHPDKGMLRDFQ